MTSNSRRSQAKFGNMTTTAIGDAQTSTEGQTTTLPCKITNPLPDMTGGGYVLEWHRDQKGLIYSAHKDDMVGKTALDFQGRLQHNGLSLIFSSLRTTDVGIYWCIVKPLKGMAGSIPTGKRIQLQVHAPPSFTKVSESDVYKRFGESARLECFTKGVPEPEMTWKKDGNPLRPRAGILLENAYLSISELEASDDGSYECQAINIAGTRNHIMRLHVTGGIRFIEQPRNQTAIEGSDASFSCLAESSPNKVSYQWFYEDQELHAAGTLALRSRIEEGTLKIRRISKEDSGWYTCQTSDGVGSKSKFKAYLDVQYKPRVLSSTPVMQFVPLGLTGRIRCDIDANPPHKTVQWLREGVKINYSMDISPTNEITKRGTVKTSRYTAQENGAILKIDEVTPTDAGEYTCQPSNDLGDSLPFEIRVLTAKPPVFESTPTPLTERTVGQAWSATCSALITGDADDQKPDVFWRRKDGTRVPYSKNGRLHIESVTEFDHGCYDCVVRTKAAELTKEACLRVIGIVPRAPEHVSVITGAYDARLTWTPGYDGGLKDNGGQNFIAKYRPRPSAVVQSSSWTTMNASTSSELIITHLMPATDYEFVVEPRNRLGAGVPSPNQIVRTKGDKYEDLFLVPTDRPGGVTYFPNFGAHSIGPRPSTPRDLTFASDYPSIVFSWHQPSSPETSNHPPVPVFYYSLEYRQIENQHEAKKTEPQKQRHAVMPMNNFHVFADKVFEQQYRVPINRPPFMAGKTFDVRVKAHSLASYSEPSNLVSFTVPGVPPQTALIAGIAGGVAFLFLCLVLSMLAIRCAKRNRTHRQTRDSRAMKSHQYAHENKNTSNAVYANGRHRTDSLTDDTGGLAEWAMRGGTTPRPMKSLNLNSANNRPAPNGYRPHLPDESDTAYVAVATEMTDLSCPTNPLLSNTSSACSNDPRVLNVVMPMKTTGVGNNKSPQIPDLTEADLMMFPHSRESQV